MKGMAFYYFEIKFYISPRLDVPSLGHTESLTPRQEPSGYG